MLRLRAAPLAALLLFAVAALLGAAGPACSAEFTDAAGRRVILPDRISRILPAERDAEVLLYVLAPDKLAGLERLRSGSAKLPGGTRPPVLRWAPRSTPDSMAASARYFRADLIIDAGPVTPESAAFADAVQQLTGIPYILIDDSFDRTPTVLRTLGTILGVAERAEELQMFAEQALRALRGRLLILPPNRRPHVYYALGSDGLTTALPGSAAGAAIDEAGAINVAAPLGRGTQIRVSREQLLGWDPDIIIAADRGFYNALRRDRAWRALAAVRNKKVYQEPSSPFGWIEDPTGINRLIGLHWLSILFYPGLLQEDLRGTTCDFYNKFYRTRLTNAEVEAIVGPAGAPPPQLPQQFGEPLLGFGATPPPAPTPGIPGMLGTLPGTPPDLPAAADERQALCTIPGVASPITGIITGPGPIPLPAMPGGRRQPTATPPVPPGNYLR